MRAPSVVVPIVFAILAGVLVATGQAGAVLAWLQGGIAFVLTVWGAWQALVDGGQVVHKQARSTDRGGFLTRWVRG